MVKWVNHVAIAAPRNGTTSHTIDPSSGSVAAGALFTPTAGNFLLVFCGGAVTSTTPSGWTLPTGGSIVNNSGLYLWYRTAAGGDTFTTTHNASNYPCVFDIYEFPSGTTFIGSAAAGNVAAAGGAGPSLSGLTSSANFRAGVVCQDIFGAVAPSYTWSSGTEATDTGIVASGTDGYGFSVTYLEDQTGATFSTAATSTVGSPTVERLVVALNAAAAGGSQAATGTIPVTTAASGSPVARLVATGTAAIVAAAVGAPAALHPAVATTPVVSGATGAPAALHPATGSVAVTTAITGSPRAVHPATGAAAVTTAANGAPESAPGSGSHAATGIIAITTIADGSASQRHAATGTVAVTSSAAGAASIRYAAAGTCAVATSVAGTAAGRYAANGTAIVVTTATGTANVFDPEAPLPVAPPERTHIVAAETRTLVVSAESRRLTIAATSRTLIAEPEE